jgi:hypothetical protein
MKRSAILIAFIVSTIISCNNAANNGSAATKKTDSATASSKVDPAPKMDSATMAKKWQEFMTPGEMHKILASWNGQWSSEITMWPDPKKANQKMTSTADYTMIMGGRYSQSIIKGDMMGMPFEGIGIYGYDNAKKVFVASWVDNLGTGIMYMEGPWDAASKTITLKGKMTDPISGKETEMREVLTMQDDKHQTMEMYAPGPDGKEYKNMELHSEKK